MNSRMLEFLGSERICVFAVEMLDGSPHAAVLHVANTKDPLIFVFHTHEGYKKTESLQGRASVRASLAIGFKEGDGSKTFQADGVARLMNESDQELRAAYLNKFPEKREKAAAPGIVFFCFMPTWWRFTDYSEAGKKTVYTSDGDATVSSI